jgi:hypothetical protein
MRFQVVFLIQYSILAIPNSFTREKIQLYRGSQSYWWRKLEFPEKSTDLSQIRQILSPTAVSSTLRHERGSNSQL